MKPRQEKFCRLYFSGIPAGRAYEQSGYKATGAAADVSACKLLRKTQVIEFLEMMKKEATDDTIATVKERKQTLTEIMRRTKHDAPLDAIRASAELSKMDGGYEPERQELDINITIGGNAEA